MRIIKASTKQKAERRKDYDVDTEIVHGGKGKGRDPKFRKIAASTSL